MTLPTSGPLTFADIQTEFGGTNPIALNEYYAGGGLVPAGTSGTYGAVPSSGALSIQNFYGTSNYIPVYVEELFQTWLYTGNGSTQTINNGIDLSTKGGLVWIKNRTAYSHALFDTSRGVENLIKSNTTEAQSNLSGSLTSFTTSGFSLGSAGIVNDGSGSYPNNVSWTFREQPKFFDVVTWTGNNSSPRAIAHNLGSTPGCMIVKNTSTGSAWYVYHRSSAASGFTPQECILNLNNTNAVTDNTTFWASTAPTSTVFTVGSSLNSSGETYVAYLFAHNAGGFGLSGTDNVISCGSFTGTGSTVSVDLGYEPQWLMFKRTDNTGDWIIIDNMRGWTTGGTDAYLKPNTSDAETNPTGAPALNATGFSWNPASGATFIYIAIRRGPMKVPTSGTSVFEPKTMTATQANLSITGVGFPPDLVINGVRSNANYGQQVTDRLRGVTKQVFTEYDSAENTTNGTAVVSLNMNGISLGADTGGTGWNAYSGYTSVKWMFGRAPSFFDEVCYTGTGSQLNVNHNLGSVPELIIVKNRNKSGGENWAVYSATLGAGFFLWLNATDSVRPTYDAGRFPVAPTSSVFTVGSDPDNGGSFNYVAYLFATCAGVSKVGSYTGTGALQTVNCGFAAGARFVLIKRTDSTGDWFVWDSARGISSGNDPYLLLNSAAAEVTGTNYVDTTSVGFQVTAAAPAGLNANGGTYIFLAIA